MISGEEVMLKDSSCFKTSMGDEAGAAAKKGVITSKNKGKVYFQAWSMDVKFEGENVDRHLDVTTNNHGSVPGDTPTWPFADSQTPPTHDKCNLTTYDPSDCPEGETPHHLVADSLFHTPDRKGPLVSGVTASSNRDFYKKGLCICLEGQDKSATVSDDKIREIGLDPEQISKGKDNLRRLNKAFLDSTKQAAGRTASMFPGWSGSSPFALTRGAHGLFHQQYGNIMKAIGAGKPVPCTNTATFAEHRDTAASLCARKHGCDEEEIKRKLDEHYAQNNVDESTVLRSSDAGKSQPVDASVLGNITNNPCS